MKPIRKALEIVAPFRLQHTLGRVACQDGCAAWSGSPKCLDHREWDSLSWLLPTFDLPVEIGYNCLLDLDDVGERE